MPRVLVTSFEPFGGHEVNSSSEVARGLAPLDGVEVVWEPLPVVACDCVERAWGRIEATRPALVLALGQAGSSPRVRLEDRGVNFDHFHMPDNARQLRQGRAILPGGPALLRTTIPLLDVADRLRREGQPVEVSYSAGSYVCNHYYYQLLHRATPPARVLFVHLPLLPGQVTPHGSAHAMPLGRQVECVRRVLRACLE
jgi:pyroglutamyl-peptidase